MLNKEEKSDAKSKQGDKHVERIRQVEPGVYIYGTDKQARKVRFDFWMASRIYRIKKFIKLVK